MEDIKDIVNDVVRDLEKKRLQHQKDIHHVWLSCVKTKEAEHTKVEGIKDSVLYVNADCSAWMFQCRLRYKTILQNIQKEFPDIKRIYFKVGKTT
jgi:predicted nucleic acid-binding Zn ribbon protein